MKECRFCKKTYEQEAVFCPYCGYDSTTDAIHPSFIEQQKPEQEKTKKKIKVKEKKEEKTRSGIDPRIKKFAMVGVLITLFSLFYKYNFRISIIWSDLIEAIDEITAGKIKLGGSKKTAKGIDRSKLIDIGSFKGSQVIRKYKGLVVEGIFYDPDGESFVTINGIVYSQGNSFDNVKIKKINIDSVEVIVDGVTKVLEVE